MAMRTGDAPARMLESLGISVISTYDRVEEAVRKAAGGMVPADAGGLNKKEIC